MGDHPGSPVDAVSPMVPARPLLVWCGGLPPESWAVAASTTIRLVCFEGPAGRHLVVLDQGGHVETIFERVGALDVHKAQVTACVRVPDAAGRRAPHVAEFQTTVQGLIDVCLT